MGKLGGGVGEEKERRRIKGKGGKRSESRYNRWYKVIKDDGIPGYLKKKWKEGKRNRLAKFRLGNVMREGGYWGMTRTDVAEAAGGR